MTKPPSIARFEHFYWASVILGLVGNALNWKVAQATLAANPVLANMGWLLPTMQVIGIAVSVTIWFFVVRQHSVVAKWVQVVFAALGGVGLLYTLAMAALGNVPVTLQLVLGIVGNLLYIAAAVMLFRPDAKLWLGEGIDDGVDDLPMAPRA